MGGERGGRRRDRVFRHAYLDRAPGPGRVRRSCAAVAADPVDRQREPGRDAPAVVGAQHAEQRS